MKPGNLSERKRCQIRRQTKDEDSIYAHRVFGVRFFCAVHPVLLFEGGFGCRRNLLI